MPVAPMTLCEAITVYGHFKCYRLCPLGPQFTDRPTLQMRRLRPQGVEHVAQVHSWWFQDQGFQNTRHWFFPLRAVALGKPLRLSGPQFPHLQVTHVHTCSDDQQRSCVKSLQLAGPRAAPSLALSRAPQRTVTLA